MSEMLIRACDLTLQLDSFPEVMSVEVFGVEAMALREVFVMLITHWALEGYQLLIHSIKYNRDPETTEASVSLSTFQP